MTDKITIVKILGPDGKITTKDLEKWRKLFAEGITVDDAVATGEVDVEVLPEKDDKNHYMTLVKIGGDEFKPSMEDLEHWRQVFEEAKGDPDFKVFTHPSVEIDVIHIGKIIAVE